MPTDFLHPYMNRFMALKRLYVPVPYKDQETMAWNTYLGRSEGQNT